VASHGLFSCFLIFFLGIGSLFPTPNFSQIPLNVHVFSQGFGVTTHGQVRVATRRPTKWRSPKYPVPKAAATHSISSASGLAKWSCGVGVNFGSLVLVLLRWSNETGDCWWLLSSASLLHVLHLWCSATLIVFSPSFRWSPKVGVWYDPLELEVSNLPAKTLHLTPSFPYWNQCPHHTVHWMYGISFHFGCLKSVFNTIGERLVHVSLFPN